MKREQNKQDKLRRITDAARKLFHRKGYDDATMREIAKAADVGLGTLFSYASDKRDLLFLIYTGKLEALTQEAIARRSSTSLVQQVVDFLEVYYEFFSEQPEFMRYVLRELTFFTSGQQAERLLASREEMIRGIEELVTDAKKKGLIRTRANSRIVAHLFFGIFQAEVRVWLQGKHPTPRKGIQRLKTMLRLIVDGLEPASGN